MTTMKNDMNLRELWLIRFIKEEETYFSNLDQWISNPQLYPIPLDDAATL